MKVLYQARPDLYSSPGGDTTQIIQTKTAVEKHGIKIDISFDPNVKLSGYDLVHTFNLTRPQEPFYFAMNARRQNKPVVLSTIYWDLKESRRYEAQFSKKKRLLGNIILNEDIKSRIQYVRDLITLQNPGEYLKTQRKMGFKKQQKALLLLSSMILPNSFSEKRLIEDNFGFTMLASIIPNGVDDSFDSEVDKEFVPPYGKDEYVLSVAHLSARKNQIALITACADLGYPLIIIGRANEVERSYTQKCLDLMKKNKFIYINGLDRGKLWAFYRHAKVHALVSWVETPGLSSLEAGVCGCNIVTTKIGGTGEYFEDMAWYCDPGNQGSIKESLNSAYKTPKNEKLSFHIKQKFTWDQAAKETISAYMKLL